MKIIVIIILLLTLFVLYLLINTLRIKSKDTFYQMSDDQERIDKYAETLSKMIQVETVSNANDPQIEKFRSFHKTLESLFPNVFKVCEKIEIDGNLMMKWPGKNPNLAPIMFISHMDVVVAEGNWMYPPFSGTIKDGKIYGRGSVDVKSGILAFYQATEELIKDGYMPECDIYLGSSCTEEIGGTGASKMANYFKEKGIKLWMLCDEGGAIQPDPFEGIKGYFATIGLYEKGYGDLKIIATSDGGHSMMPPKNSPIVRLAKFETDIEKHNPFKVKFTPAVINMYKNLCPYCEDFKLKFMMANVDILKPLLVKIIPNYSLHLGAMLKTTMAFTTQKGSNAYNVMPSEAYVTANLRYAPFEGVEESFNIISNIASKYDLKVETIKASNATKEVNINSEQFNMVKNTINKVFPGIGIVPYVVTGGTDSRFFNEVCDNCMRFVPLNYGSAQMKGMHSIDEYLDTACLPLAVDYFKEMIHAQEKRN